VVHLLRLWTCFVHLSLNSKHSLRKLTQSSTLLDKRRSNEDDGVLPLACISTLYKALTFWSHPRIKNFNYHMFIESMNCRIKSLSDNFLSKSFKFLICFLFFLWQDNLRRESKIRILFYPFILSMFKLRNGFN